MVIMGKRPLISDGRGVKEIKENNSRWFGKLLTSFWVCPGVNMKRCWGVEGFLGVRVILKPGPNCNGIVCQCPRCV